VVLKLIQILFNDYYRWIFDPGGMIHKLTNNINYLDYVSEKD